MSEEKVINNLKPHPVNERIYGDTYDHKLISSIEKYGLQGAIEITEDNVIVSGHRRWNVCLELGYKTIPTTIIKSMSDDEIVEYLITMNQATRERTNEQIAREFEVLLEIEERKSKENQVKSGGDRKSKDYKKSVSENFHTPVKQKQDRSTDKAAAKLNANWSGRTAEKAHETVKYVDLIENTEPEVSKEIKKTLNNKSVSAAQKK